MKMKAFVLTTLTLIFVLVGCQDISKGIEYAYTTSDVSDKPLVICVDLQTWISDNGETLSRDFAMRSFIDKLEHTGGIDDAAIIFIPPTGTERKTYIDRLRIEIMAGGGPDVFLMAYHNEFDTDENQNLFEYPEQAMANGLFLPLDEFMENHTQYTEWDKQTPGVMAAGRNEEGQQIIPLSYTLPLIVYEKEEFDYIPARELFWDDMLNDPELSPYALDLANCLDYAYGWGENEQNKPHNQYYLQYILGTLYDFETESLTFTEDELLQRVNEICALDSDDIHDNPESDYYNAVEEVLGSGISNDAYNKPITMLPIYSDDGGVTAEIMTYAAINRNTYRPQEAFTVIDILMQKETQQNNHISQEYFFDLYGLPLHEKLFCKDAPFRGGDYLIDENYLELCEIRNQITGANYSGRHNQVLGEMLVHCRNPESLNTSVEELVHETYEDLQRRIKE